jgi:anti-sigma regulatory factor (Ser/Thr protein kinase)
MLARIAVGTLIRDLPYGVATDVTVLTSEVVSDAVGHASTTEWEEIVLRVNRDRRVRVEVIDGETEFNQSAPVCPAPNDSGLGLFLIDQLASAWGVDRRGDCTIVWFEVDSETSRGTGWSSSRSAG